MTTSKRTEREKRKDKHASIAEAVLARLGHSKVRPRKDYRADIVGYFRDVLGVELWAQQQIGARLVEKFDRVAGKSGRRTGKSKLASGVALWWYDCWDGRCIFTAPGDKQVNGVMWREIRLTRANAKQPIDGDMGQLARTGLRDGSGREIIGFTAGESEAMQGYAANANNPLMFIVDEASGVEQGIYDAIQGNRAGGGKLILTGNPTRTSGEFFDAFHTKQRTRLVGPDGAQLDDFDPASIGYATFTMSTEEVAVLGIPGLAAPEYLAERAREWGTDSALYRVHVLGEFAVAEDGCIFTLAMLGEAIERWAATDAQGRITIGLDPAGPGGAGDESAMAIRQGKKILGLHAKRGMSEHDHVAWCMGAAKQYAATNERVTVVLDRDGPVGWKVLNTFRELIDRNKLPLTLIPVRSSDRAKRRPQDYERVRDELAGNLHAWVKDGGALPDDPQLIAEMHTLHWEPQVTGRLKITRKDAIREELGRSPDRYDAVALACWERAAWGHDDVDDGRGDDDDTGASSEYDNPSPYGDTPSPYG